MRVPLLDLRPSHEALRAETLAALTEVLDSQRFIGGPQVEALEVELAQACGVGHAVCVSSGSDALLVSLMALGLQPGDEVITTPFTFFATAGSVLRLGARPVFVDIEPGSFNLDPTRIEAAISDRTRAILPVHLFGQMARMAPILEIARRHGLPVLEDAAQAIGASQAGARAGSLGVAGTVSFYPTKNLGGIGEGGVVLTSDAALAERLRVLRNQGSTRPYVHEAIGGNFRLDAMKAAALRVRLPRLSGWSAARQRLAARYDARFAGSAVQPPAVDAGNAHVYHQYTVRAPRRDALRAWLAERGIGSGVYYPTPLHLQPGLAGLGYAPGDLPEAERAAREVLSLPMYPGLSEAAVDEVAAAVLRFVAPPSGQPQ